MTADEKFIYFVSERPTGKGQTDIYYVEKNGKSYSEPVPVGDHINTAGDEKCVFIHPSGKVLFLPQMEEMSMEVMIFTIVQR